MPNQRNFRKCREYMSVYEETTYGIRVQVEPSFLEERSDPDSGQFFWAYRVRIENCSDRTITLRNRMWTIVSHSDQQQVEGEGVVGEQPRLEPGDVFEYASGAPLTAPSGLMVGHYEMEEDGGNRVRVQIPAFSLDSPYDQTMAN